MDTLGHIVHLLKSFDIEPKPLDRILNSYFRNHREIGAGLRRLISDVVFGVTRWRRRLDGWLNLSGVKNPDYRMRACVYIMWKDPSQAKLLDIAKINIGPFDDSMPKGFPGSVAAFYSFPDFLYQKFRAAYGDLGSIQLMERLNLPAHPVLRVNTLKGSRNEVIGLLKKEGIDPSATVRSPWGIRIPRRIAINNLNCWRKGLIEIQDEASQISVIAADPREGEVVLDACAGAGGKTLMMSMMMKNKGRVIASDPSSSKLREITKRARRAGASIETISTNELLKRRDLKGRFDLVFIDAPCSGTGTLRRSPDLKWRLREEIISQHVKTQYKLISEYKSWVKPKGRLVYVTCSLLPQENEEVAKTLLDSGEFSLADIRTIFVRHGISTDGIVTHDGFLKTDLRLGDWDGFFVAVFDFKAI